LKIQRFPKVSWKPMLYLATSRAAVRAIYALGGSHFSLSRVFLILCHVLTRAFLMMHVQTVELSHSVLSSVMLLPNK
jgi:hypothetical protein